MMLAFPPVHPSVSMYRRMWGPDSAAEPASDRPNPSKIVFFPMAITLSGMSSYFVFTINPATYLVSPGALGSSDARAATAPAGSPPKASPSSASDVLQKSRQIIGVYPRRRWSQAMNPYRLSPGIMPVFNYSCNPRSVRKPVKNGDKRTGHPPHLPRELNNLPGSAAELVKAIPLNFLNCATSK